MQKRYYLLSFFLKDLKDFFQIIFLLASFGLSAQSQLGANILGEAVSDQSGESVSMSGNGSRVAIGAAGNIGSGSNNSGYGHVRIYDYNGSAWVQVGGDIDGEAEQDYSGRSVSLSSDGSIVAIGATDNGLSQLNLRTHELVLRINLGEGDQTTKDGPSTPE